MIYALRFSTALALIAIAACQPTAEQSSAEFTFSSVDTTISSRGVAVPVTYVVPEPIADQVFPLVVLAHGHGGTRNEAGGFTQVAEGLAKRGIASIRMDFPGCGDSVESFANNNLSNMLQDIEAARNFALSLPNIDGDRVGLHGFSMGGRLALLTAAKDESYKVLVTWAPGASNGSGSMVNFVGGQDAYDAMKQQAANEGFAPFTTSWGQQQQLGLQFFTDMEESAPLEAVARIEAPLLVLYGDQDEVVLPAVSEAVIAAARNSSEVQRHVIEGADHGLGLFSDEPQYATDAVAATVSFFAARL
jgi:dienelactone hydrolase